MFKTRAESTIEIWGMKYINSPKTRQPQDINKKIIQIESVGNDNYIVEVVDKGEENEN